MSKNKFQLDYSRNKDDFFIESRKIVGLKPVTKANIDYFLSEEVSREQAEVLAAEEYLTHFLQLDREEISKLNISSTKCNKANTILYITTSEDSVIDLFRKGSKARNKNFQLVNFIPPQIYARYTAAQEVCKKLREKYENEYFTVRINRNDVDIKCKSKDEIDWKNLDMDYKDDLPEIDYTKVWSGLTRDIERKEFEEFSPNKEGRKSDALFTTDDEQKGSSSKRKEVTPIKESEKPKNKK